ncbi:MAG: mannose-6-phosphate isomerase, partial [Muribaculaceae bacterium]|nr:mannose-6-phosphate isomerase [Muribaculaceae bacterium]
MSAKLYPLKFIPQFKSVIWGGSRLAAFKATETATDSVGESWELSDVTGHESIVADGPLQGRSLRDLIAQYGDKLIGAVPLRRFGTQFPILIKLIDANDDLSVQVHPDDILAAERHNCKGKTEMWYVIDVRPGAKIHAGMAREITPDQYVNHVSDGTFTDDIACH